MSDELIKIADALDNGGPPFYESSQGVDLELDRAISDASDALRECSTKIATITRDLAAAREELGKANARVAELEAADASNKLAIERNWAFTPEHLNTVRNDPVPITTRLRGDYGSRLFPASAISIVAADMLDAANKELSRLRTQLAACASDAKASLRMVRFDGQSVWGDYYTDELEGD